jgi:hypothetical protein
MAVSRSPHDFNYTFSGRNVLSMRRFLRLVDIAVGTALFRGTVRRAARSEQCC